VALAEAAIMLLVRSTVQRTAIINVVGLTSRLLGANAPRMTKFAERHGVIPVEPVVPAVTCTAQATYLTGLPPAGHGAVANGWYDREFDEHRFWKQSERIVGGAKLWEVLRESDPEYTCAKLFWWYNMASTADFTITPRPIYCADGNKVFDIYTQPMGMRDRVKRDLGDFPFPSFWGPRAGLPSSKWIAESAKWVEDRYWPSLSLVYLPHLDYNFQRLGSSHPDVAKDVEQIDGIVGGLIDFYEKRGIEVVLLSEYGITDVEQPVHLNRVFREKGWITIKDELGTEILDLGQSRAFAIADHQVAHVYLNDFSIKEEVRATLESTPGVEHVLEGYALHRAGLDHERSGDFVVISDAKSWFTYYYWDDDSMAPDFARTVDIHRKCGYDPVELFLDPEIKAPKLRVAAKLLLKKLGQRTLFDFIPLNADLVKGSHGRIPDDELDYPVLVGSFPNRQEGAVVESTEVFRLLLEHCSRGGGYKAPSLM
jgi:predicted AlkP superfamily pyrophosphatase or phosphodiesterase